MINPFNGILLDNPSHGVWTIEWLLRTLYVRYSLTLVSWQWASLAHSGFCDSTNSPNTEQLRSRLKWMAQQACTYPNTNYSPHLATPYCGCVFIDRKLLFFFYCPFCCRDCLFLLACRRNMKHITSLLNLYQALLQLVFCVLTLVWLLAGGLFAVLLAPYRRLFLNFVAVVQNLTGVKG